MSDTISIMMITYNRLELTKITISNLINKTPEQYNLIIVDNGSTDGTVEYLQILNNTKLILNKENLGIGRGRNQALYEADKLGTDWYVSFDNDIDVPKNWLSECIGILKSNPSYGAIGVNMEDTTYPIIEKNGYTFQNKPKGNLGTACMVFGRKLHKAIGYFREYNKYGLEDSDFGMRARFAGFNLGYIKEPGIHLGVGELDKGEYRKLKTKLHDERVPEFQKNCSLYANGQLSLYIKCPKGLND